jgi:urea transport system substrate-binding protein
MFNRLSGKIARGLALALAACLSGMTAPAKAADTIRVGILHSLSGTMAIDETTLKDVMLMLIDQQNKKGGLLGKTLEPVVVDPMSNWPLFREKARDLITKGKVAVVFGCWTSVSRKSVLPVFEELNNILFYPVQYEGEESERNVFYTGAVPNQQAIPAVDYLMQQEKVKRWVLEGTDFVYPRTTNKILEAYLLSKGVPRDDIMIGYTPFGHDDWQTIVADIKKFSSAGKKTAVVSTVNGDANTSFYQELRKQGIKPSDIPVLALSIGEQELAGIDVMPLVGHLAAWNYFESIKTPANEQFIRDWQAFTKSTNRTVNDPMEAHYIGFNMWVKAVEKVKSTDPDKVIDALAGIEAPNLTGGVARMLANHHITKQAFIGEIRADGQFDVIAKTPAPIAGEAWSSQLEGSKDLIGDWVGKKCGNFNVRSGRCGNTSVANANNPPRPSAAASSSSQLLVTAVPKIEPPPPLAAVQPSHPAAQPSPLPPPPVAAAPPPVSPPVAVAPTVSPPAAVSQVPNQGRRIALVIGNSNYKSVAALSNPREDAKLIADTLKKAGFASVTLQLDLGRDAFIATLSGFAAQADSADWAMVYYAGHGMEVAGTNYLIPVDAKLSTDRDASLEAVSLDQIRNVVGRAKRLRLIVLDACRDNPFASQMRRTMTLSSRSVSRGLAAIEPEAGSLIVYAAKDGETALDGDSGHSPFAAALAKNLLVPGLEVRRLFDTVRDDVLDATNQQQQPFSYGSLSGRQDFYFVARK